MSVASEDYRLDMMPISTKTGVDPAIEVSPAGAAYMIEIAAGKVFRPMLARMTLVASGDAANRQMQLYITDGTTTLWASALGGIVTAGLTQTQTWSRMSMLTTPGTLTGLHMPDITMLPGWKIYVYIANFDTVAAGDNAGPLIVYGQEGPA